MNSGICDGTATLANSPLHYSGCGNIFGDNPNGYIRYSYPVQDQSSAAAMGLLKTEFGSDGLYVGYDKRRRNCEMKTAMTAHKLEHRRAQNRASQRAFRDKRKKQMKQLEERIAELQERHGDLIKSYKSLQLEYSIIKQDLETLQRDKGAYVSLSPATERYCSGPKEQEDCSIKIANPLEFGSSAFYYGQEEETWLEGINGLS